MKLFGVARSVIGTAALATVMVTGALTATASTQAEDIDTAATCSLHATIVNQTSGGTLYGDGGRYWCTNQVSWVRVEMMKGRILPDQVIASVRRSNATNTGDLRVTRVCQGNANYYMKTKSSTGAETKSAQRRRC